ncbi:MAG: S1-like domain-containing RNA-binding protein [Flavobacteriaceae bacterium]
MIELGNYNTLKINRKVDIGLYLTDDEGNEVLLPGKYAPENAEPGQDIEIFCYLDNEERPIATTLKPFIKRNEFGYLRVAEVNEYGAFLDWGLEKHLLVPFREQLSPMEEGKWYVVYCYLDEKSFRLAASGRLERFLDNTNAVYDQGQEVRIMITRQTELGWEVVIEGKHKGLVYSDEVYQPVTPGDRMLGYVKKVRSDQKIDISLQSTGYEKLESSAQKVYDALIERGGVLKLHDRSDPQDIKNQLQMSKKTFKRAIGILYKARRISIAPDGIYKK